MKYNQFSFIPESVETCQEELQALGFQVSQAFSDKENLETFCRHIFFQYKDTDYALSRLIADKETSLLAFFQSHAPLTTELFDEIALQLLGFIPGVDFEDASLFSKNSAFPVHYHEGNILLALYHLLATRKKEGITLIDDLVSQGLIPITNTHQFFNHKALATFDTSQLIREIVYVQTPLDTDKDGQLDLVKVNIIRPKSQTPLPTIMTASPYHQGMNNLANDKQLHDMVGELPLKEPKQIIVEPLTIPSYPQQLSDKPIGTAEETFHHIDSYTLNDYLLARGYANLYVSGIGTAGSDGFMTSGDYKQVESFKAVIDWLNGRAIAFSSHRRDKQVLADWSDGQVCTTGKSYLGTLSTALATTGVEGLKVIISESAISSWYDYYRENGLVCSPGGYPGEDLDVLTALTYSRSLWAGDFLRQADTYHHLLEELSLAQDRQTGDYSQFWHNRNYLPHLNQISATLVYTHGLQDWNVKPRQVFQVLNNLPHHIEKHAFLHHGQHVYLHNWQSIDFRESMNALLAEKLLGQESRFSLPEIIWQNNATPQTWQSFNQIAAHDYITLALGKGQQLIDNHYSKADFERYCKSFKLFKQDLFAGKANAIQVDIDLPEDYLIKGEPLLHLTLKSSTNKGILAAQVLDYGDKKRLTDTPQTLQLRSIDNGRNFSREDLKELPFVTTSERVISKGVMNLQNRTNLLTVESIPAQEWLTVQFALQPSLYQLKKGDTLRILLYTTDFEHTIRDNSHYALTVDLGKSFIEIPINK